MVIKANQNTIKRMQMNNHWMQKEEDNKKKENEKDLTPEMRQLLRYEEDMRRIREQKPKADIDAKLKAGADLSPEEIEYLKKNDPDAYREYEEIKREKENYEKQLKNCKTKEDVERLKMNKMGQFMAEAKGISQNPNIPKGKKLGLMEKLLKKVMGINTVHIAFTRTSQYQNLPTEEEIEEEEKKKKEKIQPDTIEETEETVIPEEFDEELEDIFHNEKKPAEIKSSDNLKHNTITESSKEQDIIDFSTNFNEIKMVIVKESKKILMSS